MNRLLTLVLLALVALFAAACGSESTPGGGETPAKPASADSDPTQLLKQAFSDEAGKSVKSAKFDLKLDFKSTGGAAKEYLPNGMNVKINGGFESLGEDEFPKFVADLGSSVAGQDFLLTGGSTGDKLFIKIKDESYVVSDADFKKFKAEYEEARKQSAGDLSFATLGIDASKWLKDPKVDGEADVAGAKTVKVSGEVDVPRALDDVITAANKAGELDPTRAKSGPAITPEDRRKAIAAVKSANVEFYIGAEDQILRRAVLDLDLVDGGKDLGTIKLDLSVSALNEPVDVELPANAKPLGDVDDLGSLLLDGGTEASAAEASPSASSSLATP